MGADGNRPSGPEGATGAPATAHRPGGTDGERPTANRREPGGFSQPGIRGRLVLSGSRISKHMRIGVFTH
eukprot:9489188-Pyramimonas_sp.AAC.1